MILKWTYPFLLLPSLVMATQSQTVLSETEHATNQTIGVMSYQSSSQQKQDPLERIFWNKTPVTIHLKTGSERMIHFPDVVRVMPPKERSNNELKITIVDNVVYLKALRDFPTGRMRVQMFNHSAGSFDGGSLYLFDLSAQPQGGTETIQLIDKTRSSVVSVSATDEHLTTADDTRLSASDALASPAAAPLVDMVELVRYVSQQLYAPERLVQSHPAIYRTPLRVNKKLHTLYRGAALQATPLASWKGGLFYVTAVKIQNQTDAALTLDPRRFRGQWRSRTLQHTGLSAYLSETDTTTVYLVSDRPFDESLWF